MVNDTSRERNVANTTVSPNCLKNWPTMSVRNAIGAKTTTSHSVIATAASPISIRPAHGGGARVFAELDVPVHVFQDDDGVVHEDADAQAESHQGNDVQREVEKPHREKRPTRETGMATRTISEERQRRRNRKSTRAVVMMLSTRFSRVSSRER